MKCWMSRRQLEEELDYSKSNCQRIFHGIRKEIGNRYGREVVAGTRINYFAVIDFLIYEADLNDENLRKKIPPFDPESLKRLVV